MGFGIHMETPQRAGKRLRYRDGMRGIASTAAFNVVVTVGGALAGLIIARELGPSVRGQYAAATAWYGVFLIIGELGLTAATCYYVARDPRRAPDYVATSRAMMTTSGVVAIAVGLFLAPSLSRGDEQLTAAYRIVFVTCSVSFIAASYIFALQARSIRRWNYARVVQPLVFLAVTCALLLTQTLSLTTVLLALAASVLVQAVAAHQLCRRTGLTGGRLSREGLRRLAVYGMAQVAATAPLTINTRVDQLVLSQTVPLAELGHYAVAASVTTLIGPLVSAIGSVTFPRIAARHGSDSSTALGRTATRGALLLSSVLMLPIALSANWAVPFIFGEPFRAAVPLVWVLAPGGVFLVTGMVVSDVLRGRNETLSVAKAQIIGAVATALLLILLLPRLGAMGAAVASTTSYAISCVLLFRSLRRSSGPTGPGATPSDEARP